MKRCGDCCKECSGTGLVETGDWGGPAELMPCPRCDGDGKRRCDVEVCSALATVDWPTNLDRFCEAHVLADATGYFDALKAAAEWPGEETRAEMPVPMATLVGKGAA